MKNFLYLSIYLVSTNLFSQKLTLLEKFNDCVLPTGASFQLINGTEQFKIAPNLEDIS